MNTKRYCFVLDLQDNKETIAKYRKYHKKIWPEITKSILAAGIIDMEIYLSGNRLFMIMETDESFSFERKAILDARNQKVLEWEKIMSHLQKPVKWAKKGEKWVLMEEIFSLHNNG